MKNIPKILQERSDFNYNCKLLYLIVSIDYSSRLDFLKYLLFKGFVMEKILDSEKIVFNSLNENNKVRITSVAILAFSVLLIANALAAYCIINIPLEWLSQVGFIVVIIFLFINRNLYFVLGSKILFSLFFWAIIVTSVNIFFKDYNSLMPSLSTTSYPLFVCLRFIKLLSFIAAIYLTYWLLVKGERHSVIKWTVVIGTVVSIIAIYYYFVRTYGLPALLPNRLSTGGRIPTEFGTYTYVFHRAAGTFREPSHLAEWLVMPFFLSFIYCKKKFNIYAVIIGTTILLTGSMTGIVGGIIGFIAAIIINNVFKLNNLKIFIRVIVLILIVLIIFNVLVISYTAEKINIFKIINNRLSPILFKGEMLQSNREYVYKYISNNPPSLLFGSGLGNANILFSKYLNSNLISSFLSLYLNYLYSTGVLGLIFLCIFLFNPVVKVMLSKKIRQDSQIIFINAPYISYLVMFTVSSEEFIIMFAIIYALMVYEIRKYKKN